MGRLSKDGTFTAKPSTCQAIERLYEKATPLPIYRRNSDVEVFMGAGWGKGVVEFSDESRCLVLLKIGQKRVTCYDQRCIRKLSK